MSDRDRELVLDGAVKAFDGDAVINGVSVRVGAGERVAVVGPSGAGKTTLLRLLSGAVSPDSGAVLLGGEPLDGSDVAHAYPGETLVGRRSALANVLVGGSSSRSWWRGLVEPLLPRTPEPAVELLDRVGIADKADARADSLSAGERQRVAFARALMQEAPVVVADEPTANLDPSSRETVLEVLDDVVGDRTLITALHDMELAASHNDRVLGLADGEIRFDRPAERVTPAELEATFDANDGERSAAGGGGRSPVRVPPRPGER